MLHRCAAGLSQPQERIIGVMFPLPLGCRLMFTALIIVDITIVTLSVPVMAQPAVEGYFHCDCCTLLHLCLRLCGYPVTRDCMNNFGCVLHMTGAYRCQPLDGISDKGKLQVDSFLSVKQSDMRRWHLKYPGKSSLRLSIQEHISKNLFC